MLKSSLKVAYKWLKSGSKLAHKWFKVASSVPKKKNNDTAMGPAPHRGLPGPSGGM